MKAYLLLLPISFLPAVAGILVTRPMWRIRQLPNEAIQGIGLVVMISVLIGCLVPLFLGDTGAVGCACILLSLFNLVIFQYYEQRLTTSRCPQCTRATCTCASTAKDFTNSTARIAACTAGGAHGGIFRTKLNDVPKSRSATPSSSAANMRLR